ncbi:MAG: dipeptidase [Propioniciclava sp.]|uniref:dipeptidase n=1 Tax=Propioniciclava sp. TaxID=2038686 RepID=UPI0039E4112F
MTDLRDRVNDLMPGVYSDLAALVAIPSVSSIPEHHPDVQHTADAVAGLMTGLGCPDVRIVAEGGQPAVIARFPAPEGAPTVCLYAHHDVQQAGDETLWTSAPFEATERDGRLYGRGAVDDKAGIAVHLAALRAFDGRPPVGVTVFVEGEEEIGSPSLARIMERHADLLAADLYVICDSGNWQVGTPSFTTALRGLADTVVEVRTLDHALHSGQYGGAAPDALTTLIRLLATLHDENGDVAVAGLATAEPFALDYPEDRLRAETGILDGVRFTGTGPIADRLWGRPAITVLAVDSTPIAKASNTLVPSARAKVSMRLAPNQDPAAAMQALQAHLLAHAPFGAQVSFHGGETGSGTVVPSTGPIASAATAIYADAWGEDVVEMGQGGSIPMVADFQRAFPEAEVLVVGVVDPDSRMHGIDESVDLGDIKRAALSEALLLEHLAREASV